LTDASPPHAPPSGLGKRLLGPFHGTGAFWFRMLLLSGRIQSPRALKLAELCFRWLFYLSWGALRRAVAANLEPVLGPAARGERRRRVHRTLQEFAYCQYDRYRALGGRWTPAPRFEGLEHWDAATSSGRGVVLVTAHIGGWEIGSATPSGQGARSIHVVRERETDPRAQALVETLLARSMPPGYHTHFLDTADGGDVGFELVRALRDGDLVAVQGDRPRRGGRSVEGTLFSRRFRFPVGPALLARAGHAALLPVFSFREKIGHYRVSFRRPIEADSLREAVDLLARAIEDAIRERPHQWFAFGPVWEDAAPAQEEGT
jgi:lauroyl/myristoyl acyltransferase